jgi:uncharacterized protein (DUF3820 family)
VPRFSPKQQLAWEQQQEFKTIPFGKHKGCALRDIFSTDPQYLAWLLQQDWFRVKFGSFVPIHQRASDPIFSQSAQNACHSDIFVNQAKIWKQIRRAKRPNLKPLTEEETDKLVHEYLERIGNGRSH